MNENDQVAELLREALDSESTPEQVCAMTPHLLSAVRRRWEQCRKVRAELGELFPSSNPTARIRPESVELPCIPGYQVKEVLGHGGVGIVYRATQSRLERSVALKMLIAGPYADLQELSRFRREMKTIAGLHHTNIVQIYSVGEFEGRPYFAMEFIEGGSLARKLAGVPQATATATEILLALSQAVQSAHRSGIIHRDLKPANILMTTDGVPKICDFGLARQYELDDALTVSGARIGTPSYMAPEQAFGQSEQIGPAADIYSLGAILYEMLTGRPPFRAESAIETERQLLTQDPVAPSRLNSKVPRDLDTVCLKCLQKNPTRRYADADALINDLRHFQHGEPIIARRTGAVERSFKWARRHPAATAIALGAGLFVLTMAGWLTWAMGQRSELNRAISDSLAEVTRFERQSAWSDARMAQERVKARLTKNTPAQLRKQADQNDADLAMVAQLDSVRLARTPLLLHDMSDTSFRDGYTAAFADGGYGTSDVPPEQVAEKINKSNIKTALVDAVYDWTASAEPARLIHWLDEIELRCDASAGPWIARARKAASSNDRAAMAQLLEEAPTDPACIRMITTLAVRLQRLGGDGISFMTQVQRAHPDDFWTAYDLAVTCMNAGRLEDALRYFQVCAALRPRDAVVSSDLGVTFWTLGRNPDGIEQLAASAAMDANSWLVQSRYANALFTTRDFHKAVTVFDHAWTLRHEPDNYAKTATFYAIALDNLGRTSEACSVFEDAISTDLSVATPALGSLHLIGLGYGERIFQTWKRSLHSAPRDEAAYDHYAELALYLGHEEEYRNTCSILLSRFADEPDPRKTERIARACLLLPIAVEQQHIAAAMIERCVNADKTKLPGWVPPYFQFSKALADYRLGNYQESVAILHGVAAKILGPAPALVAAMAEFRSGETDKANEDYRSAVASFDWSPGRVNTREDLIYHILRRQAETLLRSNPTPR